MILGMYSMNSNGLQGTPIIVRCFLLSMSLSLSLPGIAIRYLSYPSPSPPPSVIIRTAKKTGLSRIPIYHYTTIPLYPNSPVGKGSGRLNDMAIYEIMIEAK